MLALLFILLLTDTVAAYNPPRGKADVLRRSMSSSAGWWLAKFGHVAIYEGRDLVLEATDGHGSHAVQDEPVASMTRNGYKGARYGKANSWQGDRVIKAGKYQQANCRPHYTISPWYRAGGWGYLWRWSWRKGFYKKWFIRHASFRCDSFVNYCYKKGTGRRLVNRQWTTLPYRIHKALPYRR